MKEIKEKIKAYTEEHLHVFKDISDYVYHHPELGGEEVQSSVYIAERLKELGFKVEFPYEQLPTAFVAEYGPKEAEVTVAFLPEYDALPGYGPDGTPGHACGHNWIAGAMAGCGAALAAAAEQVNCRVKVIGTPAEESFGAKVDLVNLGAFEDVDFVFQAHLANHASMGVISLAMHSLEFDFHGKAAHAAASPELGINALDGVISMFNSVNAMREHFRSDARIHGIITKGGEATNIVPEFAQCRFGIRARNRGYLQEMRRRVLHIAEAAALATGTTMEYRDFENQYDEIINVSSMSDVWEKYFNEEGLMGFVPEEKHPGSGSSDLGNVCYKCPTVYAEVPMMDGTPVIVHDRCALEMVNSEAASEVMKTVITAMAAAAAEISLDKELAARIRADYEAKRISRLKG